MYKCADTTVSGIPSITMVSPMSYKVCSIVMLSTYLSEFLDDTLDAEMFVLELVYVCFFFTFVTIVVRDIPVGTGVTQAGQPTVHAVVFVYYHFRPTSVRRYMPSATPKTYTITLSHIGKREHITLSKMTYAHMIIAKNKHAKNLIFITSLQNSLQPRLNK